MQRICPFLALDEGGRTVVDGYDATHRCRSTEAAEPVERARQASACLSNEHVSCERYVAAMRSHGEASWPLPAADTAIAQTRLILPVSTSRRLMQGTTVGGRSRRWMVGAGLATIGVAAIASGVAGGLGGGAPAASPSPASGSSADATPAPPIGSITSQAPATPRPTATTSPEPTAAPTSTPTAAPTPTPTPEPQQLTYVVQPGDTLNGIALHFRTSVAAIQAANGMGSSDLIVPGQVLIIP